MTLPRSLLALGGQWDWKTIADRENANKDGPGTAEPEPVGENDESISTLVELLCTPPNPSFSQTNEFRAISDYVASRIPEREEAKSKWTLALESVFTVLGIPVINRKSSTVRRQIDEIKDKYQEKMNILNAKEEELACERIECMKTMFDGSDSHLKNLQRRVASQLIQPVKDELLHSVAYCLYMLQKNARFRSPTRTVPMDETNSSILTKWFNERVHDPYPTEQEKIHLLLETGLSMHQICSWFSNHRLRFKKKEIDKRAAETNPCKLPVMEKMEIDIQ